MDYDPSILEKNPWVMEWIVRLWAPILWPQAKARQCRNKLLWSEQEWRDWDTIVFDSIGKWLGQDTNIHSDQINNVIKSVNEQLFVVKW